MQVLCRYTVHVKPLEEYLKKLSIIIVTIIITNTVTSFDRLTLLSTNAHATQSHMPILAVPR